MGKKIKSPNPRTGYDLTRERIAITGALGGIGSAIAQFYMGKGLDAILLDCDATRLPGTNKTRKDLMEYAKQHSVSAWYYSVDLRDPDQISKGVKRIADTVGSIAHLINVAGKPDWEEVKAGFLGSNYDQLVDLFSTNTLGPLQFVREMTPLIAQDGHPLKTVILISSISGIQCWMNQGGYGASKGALIGFTLSSPGEFADYGIKNGGVPIRIFSVLPGTVRAPASDDGRNYDKMTAETSTGRLASPWDVASTCYGASHYLINSTGQILIVDGGQSIQRKRPDQIK